MIGSRTRSNGECLLLIHYCFLEYLGRSKAKLLGSFDLDGFSGARIASFACLTVGYLEDTEASDVDLLTFAQKAGKGLYEGV